MDRDWGSNPGSGRAASAQNEAFNRREHLQRLALETIDLAKDPYFMSNHLGSYECKLCLTLHNNEGNYLAQTQGKRHQTNLAKRAACEAKEAPAQPQPHKCKVTLRKSVKIGRPGYRVTKQFDPDTKQRSLLFQIEYPEIEDLTKPRHRFMSSFEQLQLYFKSKPPESNKPQSAPTANGTATTGVPPRPLPLLSQAPSPPPPQGLPLGAPFANPPRGSPPSVPPPPPPSMGNGARPMPPGGTPSAPPPPPVGSGTMANFTPMVRPPPMLPPQGFPGQGIRPAPAPPPPPPNMGH